MRFGARKAKIGMSYQCHRSDWFKLLNPSLLLYSEKGRYQLQPKPFLPIRRLYERLQYLHVGKRVGERGRNRGVV